MNDSNLDPSSGAPASFRQIDAAEAGAFAKDILMSATRTRAVVAVTTEPHSGRFPVDPAELAREVGAHADVVALETGDATWALSEALPARLDVYGGAARIWWPGLSRTSDPYDHPLLVVHSAGDADIAARRVVAAVRDGDPRARRYGPWRPSATGTTADAHAPAPTVRATPPSAGAVPRAATKAGKAVGLATVTGIDGPLIRVRLGETDGVVRFADERLEVLATRLTVGQSIPVFQVPSRAGGAAEFSTQGLLGRARPRPSAPTDAGDRPRQGPDPWRRLVEVYEVGDVVRGRICRVEETFVLVEVLPGVALLAPLSELDWTFVSDPAAVFHVGERVKVTILTLDPETRRGTVSIKQAYPTDALPAVSPGPGQPLFLDDDGDEPVQEARPEESDSGERVRQLTEELDSALADRAELMKRVKELRKDLRSAEDRLRAAEGESDPAASETAFLAAVRVEYARRFNEGDRQRYPLQRMRVGRAFLGLLRCLHGISVEKVVEVCAQLACLRAHEIPARDMHELRAGAGGAPARTRGSDGAKAWRCSLQDGTPAARRLHWWDIPGKDGRTIEFASVSVHDDYSIPS